MNNSVYKILTESQWNEFASVGSFAGSPADIRDGFIHLSAAQQVDGVVSRYYADQRPLYIVEFSAEVFGDCLRWELASNGEKFPHVYGRALLFAQVKAYLLK